MINLRNVEKLFTSGAAMVIFRDAGDRIQYLLADHIQNVNVYFE